MMTKNTYLMNLAFDDHVQIMFRTILYFNFALFSIRDSTSDQITILALRDIDAFLDAEFVDFSPKLASCIVREIDDLVLRYLRPLRA